MGFWDDLIYQLRRKEKCEDCGQLIIWKPKKGICTSLTQFNVSDRQEHECPVRIKKWQEEKKKTCGWGYKGFSDREQFASIINGFEYYVDKYANDKEKVTFKNQIKKARKLVEAIREKNCD